MSDVFIQISIVILLVLAVSFVMRLLKQPLIIGYIISGILIGPYFLGILPTTSRTGLFSELGIALLLFIVGLHLSPKVIKEVGRISLIAGLGQIVFTGLIGYFISSLLGFSIITSLYIAIALTFSSTIIILKLLSDKGDLDNLYGKISIGILLVHDFIAIMIIIILTSYHGGANFVSSVGLPILKGTILILVLAPISIYILPKLQKFFARSQELLFVFAIAWGLGLASLFFYAGLSIEVGALIAGVLLSVSPYNLEMSSKLKPLRDLSIILFFLLLGVQMGLSSIGQIILPAIIFSLIILVINPIIVMSMMSFGGYTKKTNFFSSLSVAMIGEFSLIIVALGVKIGHISNEILSLITLTSIITIGISTYFIIYASKVYASLSRYLSLFERKSLREKRKINKKTDAILFGYNRIGFGILTSLKKIKENYLVVDFNPDTITNMQKLDIPCLYGDVDDDALLNELPLKNIKIAVSTIPEIETNELLLKTVKSANPQAIVILRAHTIEDAMELYKHKADYVLTPHFLGGEYLADMIKDIKLDTEGYKKERERHIKMLNQRFKHGHDHPFVEKN